MYAFLQASLFQQDFQNVRVMREATSPGFPHDHTTMVYASQHSSPVSSLYGCYQLKELL